SPPTFPSAPPARPASWPRPRTALVRAKALCLPLASERVLVTELAILPDALLGRPGLVGERFDMPYPPGILSKGWWPLSKTCSSWKWWKCAISGAIAQFLIILNSSASQSPLSSPFFAYLLRSLPHCTTRAAGLNRRRPPPLKKQSNKEHNAC